MDLKALAFVIFLGFIFIIAWWLLLLQMLKGPSKSPGVSFTDLAGLGMLFSIFRGRGGKGGGD